MNTGWDRKNRNAVLLSQARDVITSTFGAKGYEFWRARIGQDPLLLPHPNDATIEIEVGSRWDSKPDGAIRVLISILHATRFGILVPTTSFLVDLSGRIDIPSA